MSLSLVGDSREGRIWELHGTAIFRQKTLWGREETILLLLCTSMSTVAIKMTSNQPYEACADPTKMVAQTSLEDAQNKGVPCDLLYLAVFHGQSKCSVNKK